MKLITHRFDLPLRHTFTISYDSRDVQPTLVVELRDGSLRGFGEATENPYYGVSIEGMAAALERVRGEVEGLSWVKPEALWEVLAPSLSGEPFALCALDQAAHDLHGKRLGLPVYAVWGLELESLPLSNYTIGIAPVEEMVEKLLERPWPIYKIKLGTSDDVAIVRELRRHTRSVFRVDANGAWTAEGALANARAMADLGVEFIEQPLPAGDREGMAEVFAHSPLPLVADESCIGEGDVARCEGLFHGVNIKLTKAGGLTPARRMIATARRLGLKTMVGCMTESTVGISAIAQLLPLLDYVDMDGALLLARDIARGVSVVDGAAQFPDRPGTGVELLA